jgi:hypothetical protein
MLEDIGRQGEHKPLLFSKPGTWNNPVTTIITTTTTVHDDKSTSSASSPTTFALTDVMVCRCPKVGSSMLRQIHTLPITIQTI